ncbi:MAG TPA: hypothetical protein EYQ00_05215 [Dehalococcoidia bacterium]|nr:hypothetical protein [Dehalococcoidia bacterium]
MFFTVFCSDIQKIKTRNKETSAKNLLFFDMRIYDEINPFKQGDSVVVKDEPSLGVGIVSHIRRSSVYYEARPIASYDEFRIYVKFLPSDGDYDRSYRIHDLESASQ